MVVALGATRAPEAATTALGLVLGKKIDPRETAAIVWELSGARETRDLAVGFVEQHFSELAAALPPGFTARMPWVASGYCDEAHKKEADAFFRGRTTTFLGGPRELEQALEVITRCEAFVRAQQPSFISYLKEGK
jgi:hypothetical protein